VHGELWFEFIRPSPYIGSSPRAWGTPSMNKNIHQCIRFIPTCMGNSMRRTNNFNGITVHPHVHGELICLRCCIIVNIGSSPRAWGTQHDDAPDALEGRFIPTCMGNSMYINHHYVYDSVHPHVHGELQRGEDVASICIGSSPRAWGTLTHNDARNTHYRFIPTCMGNS